MIIPDSKKIIKFSSLKNTKKKKTEAYEIIKNGIYTMGSI